jgi:hypothetical protein
MKKVLLLYALFAGNLLFAQQPETFYVWAGSGLNLRKTPDFKGEKLATLPYGTRVEWLEFAEITPHYNDLAGDYDAPAERLLEVMNTHPGFTPYVIHGYWVKVRALGQEGFLFDGYLSKMPPQAPHEPGGKILPVNEGMEALLGYLRKHRGVLLEDKDHIVFGDGTFLQFSDEKLLHSKWVFPDMQEKDGYLLLNYFLQLEKKSALAENEEGFQFNGYEGGGLVFYYDSHTNMELTVRFLYPDLLVLVSEWGGD